MAESNGANGRPATDLSTGSPASIDTIVLNVLSPSAEVPNGRISFPSMPLDTTIGHLKGRIAHSVQPLLDPARQRLIYRGRPLLNLDTTLRQIFHSELSSAPTQHPTCTIHLVFKPIAHDMLSSASNVPTPTSQGTYPPQAASPPQPDIQGAGQPDQTDPSVAQTADLANVPSNQLGMARQQHEAIVAALHPLAMPGNQVPLPEHRPAGFETRDGEDSAQRQYQRYLTSIGVGPLASPATSGHLPNAPTNPTNQGFGPITTSIQETVTDGVRTRVVVNERTFEVARQPTPDPRAPLPDQFTTPLTRDPPSSEAPNVNADSDRRNVAPASIPPTQPQGPVQQPVAVPSPFISPLFLSPQHAAAAQLRMLQDPRNNQSPWANTTTAFLLSGPEGPHALVFSPGQGVLSTAPPRTGPPNGLRSRASHRSPNTTGNRLRQQVTDAPRNAAPGQAAAAAPNPAHQPPARPRARLIRREQPNPALRVHFHRNLLAPTWTFVKLCVAIIMFTEPGTWLRKGMFVAAFFIAVMPTSNAIQTTLRWLQVQVDGILGPAPTPVRNAAAPPVPRPVRRPANGANGMPQGRHVVVTQGPAPEYGAVVRNRPSPAQEPPLAQEPPIAPEQNIFERAEQALGLFMASLVPGVGERHVRAREEARQEQARREEARREQVRQEEERQEEARAEKIRAEAEPEAKPEAQSEPAPKDSEGLRRAVEDTPGTQGESASTPALDVEQHQSASA